MSYCEFVFAPVYRAYLNSRSRTNTRMLGETHQTKNTSTKKTRENELIYDMQMSFNL